MVINKITFLSITFSFLLFCGCKKDKNPSVTGQDNTWTLENVKHIVTMTSLKDVSAGKKALVFSDTTKGGKASLFISFKAVPTSSGSYQVVEENGEPLADNQCRINGSNGIEGFILYSGGLPQTPVYITVTIKSGNKIALVIPEVNVTYAAPSPIVKLKATVYEQ
jgi:hypothetical protein